MVLKIIQKQWKPGLLTCQLDELCMQVSQNL